MLPERFNFIIVLKNLFIRNLRLFRLFFFGFFSLIIIDGFIGHPLLAKKRAARPHVDEYSSKYHIEGAFPFVTAQDWYAVHIAFKAIGKVRKSELALEFAKRLETLANAQQRKKEEKKEELKEEKKETEGK